MTEPLLAVDSLVAGYLPGVNILNGCDLTLFPDELVAVIGPNGAGKSTLLKTVFGLIPTRKGSVRLHGASITKLTPHELVARGVGFVPQNANVFPSLTVQENLEMGLYQRRKLWDERFDFVCQLFPLLAERRKQRAGSMSGGERQMVAIGRALMMDPRVLLLDEPTAGLSPRNQEEVFQRTVEITQRGIAVLMVEQNAHRSLELCHRAYVLDQGRNAHTGTGEQLLHDPKVVELYLGTLARRGGRAP